MVVSVIIPCYNGKDYLARCLDSVIKESIEDMEIIVVDDASTDSSKELIMEYEKKYPQVKGLFLKNNCGPGGAKNEGLKIAKGKYVMFIDCDDYIEENYISSLIYMANNNEKLDIIITGFKSVNQDGKVIKEKKFKNEEKSLWQAIPEWGKIYKKEWLNKNNLTLVYGKVFEDILFQAAQVLCEPKYKLTDITGYYYVCNTKSISHTTLCSFKPGSIEIEQEYLKDLKRYTNNDEKKKILEYFAFRSMCWHLLKSGCHVGKKAMVEEYDKAFAFLKSEFPNVFKNKYLNLFNKKNKDRFIIKLALYFIKIMYKIKLSKTFFIIYGKVDLSKLWPKM